MASISIPKTMKAAQFLTKGGELEYVEVPVPTIKPEEVLIKVEACGICHGDCFAQSGLYYGAAFPRTPGHEAIGRIVLKGSMTPSQFSLNQLVGVGWHEGHCFQCDNCRSNHSGYCTSYRGHPTATGLSRDGGLAQYMAARWEALIKIPEEYAAANKVAEAAPLLCAGNTVYGALQAAGARPGDVVIIQGMGGLGHLGVQYAAKLGYYTVALTTSDAKHAGALQCGANEVLTTKSDESHMKRIKELGGAKVILATAPDGKSISSLVPLLSRDGMLVIVSAPHEPVSFAVMPLLINRAKIMGWVNGEPQYAEDAIKASLALKVNSVVETFPLARANEGYKAMVENRVKFRSVILPNSE